MILVGIASFLLFVLFQAIGIYGGDSGDVVTAAVEFGVPHPPGYPLYTVLGWLATRAPLATPAWRLALLSSIPHAITVALVYAFVVRLTKRIAAGLFGALFLVGNYVFFLYSVTPEVFALFDLFVILLLTIESPYLFAFLFGLSLTHHHVVLFLVPAIIYKFYNRYKNSGLTHCSMIEIGTTSFWQASHRARPESDSGVADAPQNDDTRKSCKNYNYYKIFFFFLLGLIPYLYIPFAARGNAVINWNRAVDWQGFARLITRQDYGSFVPNGFYGALPVHRLLALKAYAEFFVLDWTWVGAILAILGFVWLWANARRMFWLLVLAIAMVGPGFFFYASFPLMNRFTLGTVERFLLPSYTLFAVVMGVGLVQLVKLVRLAKLGQFGRWLPIALFLLPVSMGAMTIWRLWGLPQDRTADRLGEDILRPLPELSILLLSRDTPLFITQYVRYAKLVRPDVVLLHANRLWSKDYSQTIRKRFPFLTVPESEPEKFAQALVRANNERYPIYTNTTFPVDDEWFWVQEGLVYKLTRREDLPSLEIFKQKNDALWESYQDPRVGILSRYRHLMLSDILSVYADRSIAVGKTLLRGGNTADAKRYFTEAIAYASDIEEQDGYTYLGLSELFDNRCDDALTAFAKARESSLVPDATLTFYEGITYRDCQKNEEKSKELLDEYDSLRVKQDIPLQ